ncbi:MAG: DNA polymerase I [Butyricicoccaceae bacterium]
MKLMAIDGNSLINRAFYGVRPLSTRDGVPTNALYGFLNMYYKLLGDLSPDAVCVCFDLKAKTFRHRMYEGYKAQRKPMPEDLAAQIPLLKECLDDMGVPRLELEGFEADDLLGTLARQCRENGDACVIVTGDRDSLQFIAQGAQVALVTTKMGQTQTEIFDAQRFAEQYSGLTADRIVDLKALMGDKSDNIPGVPGIGEKGAMDLLVRYGSLEGVYEHLDDEGLKPAMRKKLAEGRDSAFLSYDLAKGVTDVPIGRSAEDLRPGAGDPGAFYDFLNRMELRSLIKRLGLEPPASGKVQAAVETQSGTAVTDGGALRSLLASGQVVCALNDGLTAGAFVVDGRLWLAEAGRVGETAWQAALEDLLGGGGYIAHDAKPLALACWQRGITPAAPVFDTAVAAYLLSPTSSDFSLETCALTALDYALASGEGEDGQMTLGLEENAGLRQLGRRAQATDALYRLYREQLAQNGMTELNRDIELPLIPILAEMQHLGMELDTGRLRAFGDSLTAEIAGLEEKIYAAAGETFNISSPRQLGSVLFEKLGLPARKKTKTGYSTDADTLEKLREVHPIIDMILEYRKLTKLKSTYVEGLLKAVGPDGRVHSSFNQTVTATGRLSSTDPNMQNIPVREAVGAEIRKCFVPQEGWVFVDADYSQIELRVLAHIAGDADMQAAFASGEDIHTVTAAQVFGVPVDQVTPQMRSRAKAVNFGIVYGISAFSLSEDIGVFPKQAQQYMDAYLEKYHGVRDYMERIKQQAREDGFVTSAYGRRRWIPELKASNFNVRAFGERVALNTPIQGTAADIIKLAMIRVSAALRAAGMQARLILQVHDELILECPAEEREAAAALLVREMEQAASLSVPMRADVSWGRTWHDAKG